MSEERTPNLKFRIVTMDTQVVVGSAQNVSDAVQIMALIYGRTGLYLTVVDDTATLQAWIAKVPDPNKSP